MSIEWTQVIPSLGLGAFIGWFLRYLVRRFIEKTHVDEELDRGARALSIAKDLFELHEKACDRNVRMSIPLGKRAVDLLPITDDDLAAEEERQIFLSDMGRYWLISLMWHCIDLYHVSDDENLTIDKAIERAEASYISAYDEMGAPDVMRKFEDIATTQMVHAFYSFLTEKSEPTYELVQQAFKNWQAANLDDPETDDA